MTQVQTFASTISFTLPLSLLMLYVFVMLSHYYPLALAAVTAKRRPPVAAWSYCSTCHQNEVCDSCGSCHYCSDIALPCSGVLRRRINHLLAAISHQEQQPTYNVTCSRGVPRIFAKRELKHNNLRTPHAHACKNPCRTPPPCRNVTLS
jgi:hypothetical protein